MWVVHCCVLCSLYASFVIDFLAGREQRYEVEKKQSNFTQCLVRIVLVFLNPFLGIRKLLLPSIKFAVVASDGIAEVMFDWAT